MGVRFTFKFENQAEFDRSLSRFGENCEDFSPFFEKVRDDFWKIERKHFQDEGSASRGGKWKRLARATVAKKIRDVMPYPNKVLYGRGKMWQSLTSNSTGSIADVGKSGMKMGTRIYYARYHHSGVTQRVTSKQKWWLWKNLRLRKNVGDTLRLPKRLVFAMNEGDKERWSQWLHWYCRMGEEGL